MLRFRVGTGAGPVDIHATHLEHSDQEKQATQVAEITSAIPRRAVSEGGVPGKEAGVSVRVVSENDQFAKTGSGQT